MFNDDLLDAPDRVRVEARLRTWLTDHVDHVLAPLAKALKADVPASVRGIVFQLSESLGAISRDAVDAQLKSLKDEERKTLARLGIRFGVEYVFFPALLKAAPIRLRGLLWIAAHRDAPAPPLPTPGRVAMPLPEKIPAAFYLACGYRVIDGTGYRIDMLERFAAEARRLGREKNPVLPPEILSLLGIDAAAGVGVLNGLGFKARLDDAKIAFSARKKRDRKHKTPVISAPNADSPFAKLKDLALS